MKLTELARKAVKNYFTGSEDLSLKNQFKEKKGIFVTINKDGRLRGCIGFVQPVYNLGDGVIKAAELAAFKDFRFESVKQEEIDELEFEVSVLSEIMEVKDIKEIKIGRDGLIIEKDNSSGLLLPQVFKNETVEEALSMTAKKAGLNTWKRARIYRFSVEVFKE